nr:MAG TPA: hypothetical protein [Caudoviricetes sp.]
MRSEAPTSRVRHATTSPASLTVDGRCNPSRQRSVCFPHRLPITLDTRRSKPHTYKHPTHQRRTNIMRFILTWTKNNRMRYVVAHRLDVKADVELIRKIEEEEPDIWPLRTASVHEVIEKLMPERANWLLRDLDVVCEEGEMNGLSQELRTLITGLSDIDNKESMKKVSAYLESIQ